MTALGVDLRDFGVWKGQTTKRNALASKLARNEEFTERGPEDVLALLHVEFARVRREPNPGALLTSALEDGWWRELYDDLVHEHGAAQLRQVTGRDHDHGETMRQENAAAGARPEDEERDAWAYEVLRHRCRDHAGNPWTRERVLVEMFGGDVGAMRRGLLARATALGSAEPDQVVEELMSEQPRKRRAGRSRRAAAD